PIFLDKLNQLFSNLIEKKFLMILLMWKICDKNMTTYFLNEEKTWFILKRKVMVPKKHENVNQTEELNWDVDVPEAGIGPDIFCKNREFGAAIKFLIIFFA
ncbi:hypothetical protein ACJX0J_006014, partial [Zea mays]